MEDICDSSPHSKSFSWTFSIFPSSNDHCGKERSWDQDRLHRVVLFLGPCVRFFHQEGRDNFVKLSSHLWYHFSLTLALKAGSLEPTQQNKDNFPPQSEPQGCSEPQDGGSSQTHMRELSNTRVWFKENQFPINTLPAKEKSYTAMERFLKATSRGSTEPYSTLLQSCSVANKG